MEADNLLPMRAGKENHPRQTIALAVGRAACKVHWFIAAADNVINPSVTKILTRTIRNIKQQGTRIIGKAVAPLRNVFGFRDPNLRGTCRDPRMFISPDAQGQDELPASHEHSGWSIIGPVPPSDRFVIYHGQN
jgi:hypothetical protein